MILKGVFRAVLPFESRNYCRIKQRAKESSAAIRYLNEMNSCNRIESNDEWIRLKFQQVPCLRKM